MNEISCRRKLAGMKSFRRQRGEGRAGTRTRTETKEEVREASEQGSASLLPPLLYGNPSSSSELLGSSINQRLYEIPAGAKGQRRKLAAVFSPPFMLAAGLIAKCTISLISTLKQTRRQVGEELLACSSILWHWMLFFRGGGGGGGVVRLLACFYFFFLSLPPLPSPPQVWEERVEAATSGPAVRASVLLRVCMQTHRFQGHLAPPTAPHKRVCTCRGTFLTTPDLLLLPGSHPPFFSSSVFLSSLTLLALHLCFYFCGSVFWTVRSRAHAHAPPPDQPAHMMLTGHEGQNVGSFVL